MEVSFCSLEDGYDKLMYMVRKRKQLEGTSFYDEWVQDCQKFADKLTAAGADPAHITVMLEWKTDKGNYCGILVKQGFYITKTGKNITKKQVD